MMKFLVIFFFICLPVEIFSQDNITIIVDNNISFGEIVQGGQSEILISSANAARFTVASRRTNGVTITFTLPSNLTFSGNNLPITFDQNHSSYRLNINNVNGSTLFNPYSQLGFTLKNNENVFFWIGGTVTTTQQTVPGTYTGNITITVVK